jgi:hypothetical protein
MGGYPLLTLQALNAPCARQTNYLHNGAHFDRRQCRNAMAYPQGLWPIADGAPIEGHDVTALLVQAESLLEMSQIPVELHKIHKKVSHSRIDWD